MYHYVYLLINPSNDMKYIGVRTSSSEPDEDTAYLGSSKYVPKIECDKIILKEFATRKEALAYEIYLHNLYDVGNNTMFYNKSKQTSIGFDMTGFKHTEEFRNNLSLRNKTKGIKPPVNFLGKFGDAHNKSKGFWLKDNNGIITRYGSSLELTREKHIDSSCISYARINYCNYSTSYVFIRGKLKGYTVYFSNPYDKLGV